MKEHDKQQQHNKQLSRRRFLAGVASVAPTAAVVAAVPGSATAVQLDEHGAAETAKGYRLTPHILAYYKSAAR